MTSRTLRTVLLLGLAAVSVAASFGSFPFSAGYFNLVTPSGFVANLILVPIAFCILAIALGAALAAALPIATAFEPIAPIPP